MAQKRRPDLVTRLIDGETVILDREGGHVHQLNPTASYIWNECDGASPMEIAARLTAQFEETPHTVLRDVETALAEFRKLGLVVDAERS